MNKFLESFGLVKYKWLLKELIIRDLKIKYRRSVLGYLWSILNPLNKPVKPLGGGDDFAYFTEHKPGIYAMIGGRNEAKGCNWGHHHPKFDVDEDAFWRGTAMFVQMTLDYFAD